MTNQTKATQESNYLLQYTKQRKQTRIFLTTTIISVIAFVATLTLYITNPKTETKTATTQQVGPGGNFGNGEAPDFENGGPGSQGGPGRMQDISSFFSDDGSLDTDAVEQLTENVPDDFKDRMLENFSTQIDSAIEDGDITQTQGDALKAALGIN
jgi:hypothetical protein